MKKEIKKTPKKEKVTLEKLARMMAQGFENMVTKEEFNRKVGSLEQGQEETRQEIASVKEEQKDNTRRLVSIERKLTGTLISLDETVHRSEFDKLKYRVEVLES